VVRGVEPAAKAPLDWLGRRMIATLVRKLGQHEGYSLSPSLEMAIAEARVRKVPIVVIVVKKDDHLAASKVDKDELPALYTLLFERAVTLVAHRDEHDHGHKDLKKARLKPDSRFPTSGEPCPYYRGITCAEHDRAFDEVIRRVGIEELHDTPQTFVLDPEAKQVVLRSRKKHDADEVESANDLTELDPERYFRRKHGVNGEVLDRVCKRLKLRYREYTFRVNKSGKFIGKRKQRQIVEALHQVLDRRRPHPLKIRALEDVVKGFAKNRARLNDSFSAAVDWLILERTRQIRDEIRAQPYQVKKQILELRDAVQQHAGAVEILMRGRPGFRRPLGPRRPIPR